MSMEILDDLPGVVQDLAADLGYAVGVDDSEVIAAHLGSEGVRNPAKLEAEILRLGLRKAS